MIPFKGSLHPRRCWLSLKECCPQPGSGSRGMAAMTSQKQAASAGFRRAHEGLREKDVIPNIGSKLD